MNRFLPLTLPLMIVGCLETEGEAVAADAATDLSRVPLVPGELRLSVEELEFFELEVGDQETATFEFRQNGELPVEVHAIRLAPPYEACDRVSLGLGPEDPLPEPLDGECDFVILERPETPLSLDVREEREVQIRHRGLGTLTPEATLILETDAPRLAGTVELPIEALSGRPAISSTESVLSFASAPVGTLLVQNVGRQPLGVAGLELVRETPAPEEGGIEWAVEPNSSLPWRIEPQGSEWVEVTYTARDQGEDRARLIFHSDDPVRPSLEVLLTSEPISPELVVEPARLIMDPGSEASVLLRNVGLGQLDVLLITFEPRGGTFSLASDQLSSFPLRAGAEREVTVVHWPERGEEASAELLIEHNEGTTRVPIELR